MKTFLFGAAIVAALLGLAHLGVAKSAIHEIAAYVLFLTSAVCFAGAGVIEAVQQLKAAVSPGATK